MIESLAPRSDFPLLGKLTYLSTASMGLVPLCVQHAAQTFDRDIFIGGAAAFDEADEIEILEGTRTAAARLLNCDPENVAIPTSATQAISQIAWWLRPKQGSNIVSIDIEFPSSTYQWFRIAEETGAEVRLVAAREEPASLGIEAVAKLVDDRTAVICVSHLQFATGLRLSPRGLADLAHAHGAILVLDATQSAGMVPLDVTGDDVDFLVAGGYKALCGPLGAAVWYMRPEIRERFVPPMVGWRSAAEPYALDAAQMRLAAGVRASEFSTMSYGAGFALGTAIEYLLNLGIENILEHDLALSGLLMEGLDELGATILTPREDISRAGTVAARFPGHDGEKVATQLQKAGVNVAPRFGSTRFSTHFYNNEADVSRALELVERILEDAEQTLAAVTA